MGDVLTGVIAGLICQGYSETEACQLGVYLHGAAADSLQETIGAAGYLATEVMNRIPAEITSVMTPADPS
jgi:NAD(P)H-hydrate epimerase